MRRVEAEALVGARRDEVWALYDDIAGRPRWLPYVRDIVYVSGPARVGTVYRERTGLGVLGGLGQWEIVEHRRPVRQVHRSRSRRLETLMIVTFEARGTGTLVRQGAELRSTLWGPLGWLHEWVAGAGAGRAVHLAVAGAKRAFEGDPP